MSEKQKRQAIFIAATGQHVGKTTVCLGIIAGLRKRVGTLGFIKPVGQQHVLVDGHAVDKDVVLFKDEFNLPTDYKDMSPVIIPSGFTRRYLDDEVTHLDMERDIVTSFDKIAQKSEFTVVEGTGHVGVGSIVGLSNARVASLLGLEVIIVASAGLGSSLDELAMNIEMCRSHNVNVRGVILNRVLERKRSMILEYFPKALKNWGIPLLGCIPFNDFLSTPSMRDFSMLFHADLISGHSHQFRHFRETRLVAGSLKSYRREIQDNQLVITPASREDIIRATLKADEKSEAAGNNDFKSGLIMTGRLKPSQSILDQIAEQDIPCLYAPMDTYTVMKIITSYTAKTRHKDVRKVKQAIDLVENAIDFDALLECKTISCMRE
jgi:phosphate acetyltransferase